MDKGTIVRIIAFALAWLNTFLANYGYELPHISEEFISIVVAAGISVWVGWKNNSITKEAQEADAIMHEKKKAKKEAFNRE